MPRKTRSTDSHRHLTPAIGSCSLQFYAAAQFNQDLNTWETGEVTNFNTMYVSEHPCRVLISTHQGSSSCTHSLTLSLSATSRFESASVFDGDISAWNTSQALSVRHETIRAMSHTLTHEPIASHPFPQMNGMFMYAFNFNQNISAWNTYVFWASVLVPSLVVTHSLIRRIVRSFF